MRCWNWVFSALLSFLPFAGGCDPVATQGAGQLERVAKDWCLSIRASQVIPVYPLTEDVQPGDIYLVQTPIEDQVSVYKAKGFLPLENQVNRLYPATYADFYHGRYGIADGQSMPPGIWQFPTPGGSAANYTQAPRAAFPSYGFSVSRSEGLNVAVPVHAVPVGLNLLDSASASGTIAIKDAFTYGVDEFELQQEAIRWAKAHPEFVQQFKRILRGKARREEQNYLRVISRVYMTKQVEVSLFANDGFGEDVSAGVKRPVDLLSISNANAPDVFNRVNQILSPTTQPTTNPAGADADAMAIGGRVKVVMASSRSVTMSETFDRPLVIGYLAFDLPIDENGNLEPPVSTKAQLDNRNILVPTRTDFGKAVPFGADDNTDKINNWLKQDPKNRTSLREFLSVQGRNPQEIPEILYGKDNSEIRSSIVGTFGIK